METLDCFTNRKLLLNEAISLLQCELKNVMTDSDEQRFCSSCTFT